MGVEKYFKKRLIRRETIKWTTETVMGKEYLYHQCARLKYIYFHFINESLQFNDIRFKHGQVSVLPIFIITVKNPISGCPKGNNTQSRKQ